jgi:serine/threonine protein kinase
VTVVPRLLAGRYRVEGLLGQGGMGEVYYGHDERLDRRVAIKLLRSPGDVLAGVQSGSPEAQEILDERQRDRTRFVREIRVTAGLELAGIPAVYDTGEETAGDGASQIWVVMQLLRGQTVDAMIRQADFPSASPGSPWCSLPWAVSITAQVAAVLADVHRVSIVHRDIKPANLMLTDGGIVKVLDFGIAILRGASALPRLTQFDRTVGTPAYMSPEQSLGRPVSAAADIYGLGCVLHELLTGLPPFTATPSMPLRAHHVQTPPPSALARRPDVPAALDSLILAMMAKEPSQRPSAVATYEALLPYIAADTDCGESRDPTRPFRRPLLAAPPADSLAGPATCPATSRERVPLSDDEARMLLANVRSLLEAGHPSRAVTLLEDGARRADDPIRRLELRERLAAALFYSGDLAQAAAAFDEVGGEYARYLGPADPLVLSCRYQAGQAYAEIGEYEAALSRLRSYVAGASSCTDHPDEVLQVLQARFQIAPLLAATGQADKALAELREIRPLLAAAFGESSTMVRNVDRQIGRHATND